MFCLIGDSDPTYLQMGLDLLRVVKNDFGITPSRKCLDFLLHACVNAKDLRNSKLVWKEYKEAGLPYNILNFLRWVVVNVSLCFVFHFFLLTSLFLGFNLWIVAECIKHFWLQGTIRLQRSFSLTFLKTTQMFGVSLEHVKQVTVKCPSIPLRLRKRR